VWDWPAQNLGLAPPKNDVIFVPPDAAHRETRARCRDEEIRVRYL